MRPRLEGGEACPGHAGLSEAGLCKVLAQEARSAAAALPLLGPGSPTHAHCQGAQLTWGSRHFLGAGGCPPGAPLGDHYVAVDWAQCFALLSGTFRNHSSHQVGAQSRRWEKAATPEEGGQFYEEVLCHHLYFKDRSRDTANVTQVCPGQAW